MVSLISNKTKRPDSNEIAEHKQIIAEDPLHMPQDIVGDYIGERTRKKLTDPETAASYEDEHLLAVIAALFGAGVDTTATTLRYAWLFLALHKDVQKKCQEELDAVVGRDGLPSWELHKIRLPYVDATIKEIQRCADIVPIGLPHAATHDTEFRGFLIPKGAWIVSNLNACHRDPVHWPDPERFDPPRFLEEDGRHLKRNTPSFLPFAAGKRRCIGESIASMELFLHVAQMLHQFNIDFPEGFVPDLKTNKGDPITRRPAPYQIILTNRSHA